jgi:hypothetical protein
VGDLFPPPSSGSHAEKRIVERGNLDCLRFGCRDPNRNRLAGTREDLVEHPSHVLARQVLEQVDDYDAVERVARPGCHAARRERARGGASRLRDRVGSVGIDGAGQQRDGAVPDRELHERRGGTLPFRWGLGSAPGGDTQRRVEARARPVALESAIAEGICFLLE